MEAHKYTQSAALTALMAMNAAVNNLRLYPPTSILTRKFCQRAYQALAEILEHQDSLTLAESEKQLFVDGWPTRDQCHNRDQLRALLDFMIRRGLRSITFSQGLTQEELSAFLVQISLKQDSKTAPVDATFNSDSTPHVQLNTKMYVDFSVAPSPHLRLDLENEETLQLLTGAVSNDHMRDVLRARVKDLEWLEQALRAGFGYLLKRQSDQTDEALASCFARMLDLLDEPKGQLRQSVLADTVVELLIELDDHLLADLLTLDLNTRLGEDTVAHIIERMDDQRFEQVAAGVKNRLVKATSEISWRGTADIQALMDIYQQFLSSPRGERLKRTVKDKLVQERERKIQLQAQVTTGLQQIVDGDPGRLKDEQFLAVLPEAVADLIAHSQKHTADKIIRAMADTLAWESPVLRVQLARALWASEQLVKAGGNGSILTPFTDQLMRWIENETEVSDVFQSVCTWLHKHALGCIRQGEISEANRILSVFRRIRAGQLRRSEAVQDCCRQLIGKIRLGEELHLLVKEFQSNRRGLRETAASGLANLAEAAVEPLIDMLRKSHEMSERVRLMGLITEMGCLASPALRRRLHKEGPWYFIRNLVLLLGRVGSEDDVEALATLLQHYDFRVQREALNSIYSIGGQKRGKILLAALSSADDQLKTSIVTILGTLKVQAAAPPLIKILQNRPILASKSRDELEEKTCMALGHIGAQEAIPALEIICSAKGSDHAKAYPARVRSAAGSALKLLKQDLRRKQEEQTMPSEQSSSPNESISDERSAAAARAERTHKEQLVDQHINKGDKTAAVKALYELIRLYAQEKNFGKAEELREKLFETDPMALTEIIASGEIIDQEKRISIDEDHLTTWSELYEPLSTQEANALYYGLKEKVVEPDQAVYQQGQTNDRIYFVNYGQLKLIYSKGGREFLLQKLEPGDIAGHDTFFSFSICTTSMVTLTQARLSYLDKKTLLGWSETHPALESKLMDYCLKQDKIHDMIERKGLDRRLAKRFKLSGHVAVQLLDKYGNPMGRAFRGELNDVSLSGLSFMFKTPRKENARLLIGRPLLVKFTNNKGQGRGEITQKGTVVSVSVEVFDDYTIHLKFDEALTERLLVDLTQSSPA